MKARTIFLLLFGMLLVFSFTACKAGDTTEQSAQKTTQETTQEATMQPTNTKPAATGAQLPAAAGTTSVTFPTSDQLTIKGDLYWTGNADAPFIILFHQADYSRGEYLEIAPKLNALGYNCFAVDQRSGGAVNKITNETYKAAKDAGLPTGYKDAYPDLEATLAFVEAAYAPKKLIVWGSSYSSSLSLILASEHPDEIAAVLAFSPGEYFKLDGKQVADYAANITQPAFITSAKSEEKAWRGIADQIKSQGCVFFVPEANGRHGSSALFENTSGHEEYWTAVEAFLAGLN